MLYRRGRPTSVVLLLLMVVPKLSLPLGGHSPLGLHHLFRLVRAARGLVSLRGVEVLEVRARVRAARITKIGHGVGPRTGTGRRASVYRQRSVDWASRDRPGQSHAYLPKTGYILAGPGKGRDSRRPPAAPNIFPLLRRLSMARSTSETHGGQHVCPRSVSPAIFDPRLGALPSLTLVSQRGSRMVSGAGDHVWRSKGYYIPSN